MERYELLSRTNQTKLKVYNRVSNSDRYEVNNLDPAKLRYGKFANVLHEETESGWRWKR